MTGKQKSSFIILACITFLFFCISIAGAGDEYLKNSLAGNYQAWGVTGNDCSTLKNGELNEFSLNSNSPGLNIDNGVVNFFDSSRKDKPGPIESLKKEDAEDNKLPSFSLKNFKFSLTDKKYSLLTIKPDITLDDIVKNNFDLSTDYKLKLIDPFFKQKITGDESLSPGLYQNNLTSSWIDKKYSMRVVRPLSGIDNQIVKNISRPDIEYKLRVVDPDAAR